MIECHFFLLYEGEAKKDMIKKMPFSTGYVNERMFNGDWEAEPRPVTNVIDYDVSLSFIDQITT